MSRTRCNCLHALLFIARLLVFVAAHEAASETCKCHVPTPCQTDDGCDIPLIDDISKCPDEAQDCRASDKHGLCEYNTTAEDGFCCWTECSSLAMLRKCGDAPAGFEFEKTGDRYGAECHDIMNVREKCCLRELRVMRAVKPLDPNCPKLGADLAEIFETVDGNQEMAPDGHLSPTEILHSLAWLKQKGYLYLAKDFHGIDEDRNHRISWYELELYCGQTGQKLPPQDVSRIKASDIIKILENPLYVASVFSSLLLGELFGIFQVLGKHVMKMPMSEDDEGLIMRFLWTFFSTIWPLSYSGFQIYYYFYKIQWEVCDSSDTYFGMKEVLGMRVAPNSAIKLQFLTWVLFTLLIQLNHTYQWTRRKCPTRPSHDLERRIFIQQILFRKWPRWVDKMFILWIGFSSFYCLYRALFYGTVMDIEFAGLDDCKHEDPDLALLYAVNEKYFLWKVVQFSFIQVYVLIGWGIENKAAYEPLPQMDDIFFSKDSGTRKQEMNNKLQRSYDRWNWFD